MPCGTCCCAPGYRLCDAPDATALFPVAAAGGASAPRAAALRDALLTLAWPGLGLSVDDAARAVLHARDEPSRHAPRCAEPHSCGCGRRAAPS